MTAPPTNPRVDPSPHDLLETRMADPAIRLLAQTAWALRADADYFKRPDDPASGAFLDAESPARLEDDALERALARIDADTVLGDRAADAARGQDGRMAELAALPSPLREAAFAALGERGWSFGGFGIQRLALMAGEGADAELMRVEPGFGAAPHDHAAEELTLIVTGAYGDGHGRYQAGDLSLAAPGFTHAPKAEPGPVCYLLAVTYGPPRFKGVFGLMQSALGFPWAPKAHAA